MDDERIEVHEKNWNTYISGWKLELNNTVAIYVSSLYIFNASCGLLNEITIDFILENVLTENKSKAYKN